VDVGANVFPLYSILLPANSLGQNCVDCSIPRKRKLTPNSEKGLIPEDLAAIRANIFETAYSIMLARKRKRKIY